MNKLRTVMAALFAAIVMMAPAYAAGAKQNLPIPVTDSNGKCLIPLDPLKLCGELTGHPEEDMQRVVKRIQAVDKADIDYAILKAKAAGTPASKTRLQCLQAISDANDQFNGAGLKDAQGNPVTRPDPAMITGIEDVAELVDNLSPQGVLFTSCAGAAQMFKTNTLTAINSIVTGAASLAALPATGL